MVGITFDGAYTEKITAGDADFVTANTLWDMKVSQRSRPSSKDTLQILIYYIMGMHSIHREMFAKLSYLAFYNPRMNVAYKYPISKINPDLIRLVEYDIICYGRSIAEIEVTNHEKMYARLVNNEWLNTFEVCELLNQPKELVRWMARRKYISVKKRGRGYVYDPSELIKWCDESKRQIPVNEWLEIGEIKFGVDQADWKFKCPICGKVAQVREFPKTRDGEWDVYNAFRQCISYYDPYDWDNDTSCRYQYIENELQQNELAAGGILVKDNDGILHHVFDFADDTTIATELKKNDR